MKILLVEDNDSLREEIADFLELEIGFEVEQCASGRQALDAAQRERYELVVSDIRMPGMDGIQLLRHFDALDEGQRPEVILITGHGDMETAISALRAGARDFLTKPLRPQDLADSVRKVIALLEKRKQAQAEAVSSTKVETGLAGIPSYRRARPELKERGPLFICSDAMHRVMTLVERFHQDRSVPVLIEGETGTGKELISRMIHSPDGVEEHGGPFVSLNCAAISPNLFESELFGYEPGAFTGASAKGAQGKLELAAGGTLFLDEIGDLPLEQQPKLLRVLEAKEFYRVGGTRRLALDARLICATNHDLAGQVEAGLFRRDLLYRLNLGRVFIPPLRQRREAILPLAQKFLDQFALRKGSRFSSFSPEAEEILLDHPWPGNVRELRNVLERVVLLFDEVQVRPEHLVLLTRGEDEAAGEAIRLGSIVLPPEGIDITRLEAEVVRKALERFKGNKTRTAEYLGLSRRALDSRLRRAF